MRAYTVELTFSELVKIESLAREKAKLYHSFLAGAIARNDQQSIEVWQSSLDEYNSIKSKMETTLVY